MAGDSKGAVVAALVGNAILTAIKGGAWLMSGSGAMFSETLHSIADLANQALLFIGIRSSERDPTAMFPYGYGADRYLFSLLSAVGIFVLGCGVTLYHGVHSLMHPEPVTDFVMPLVVLGIAFAVDGAVLAMALRAIYAQKGDKSLFQFLRTTSDPTVLAVIMEDGAACVGVIFAAAAIGLTAYTGNPIFDAVGTLAIGALLGLIAIWLGIKNRTLLLGPAAPDELRVGVREFLAAEPAIAKVLSTKTRLVAANRFRLQADVDFDGRYVGRSLVGTLRERVPDLSEEEAHTLAEDLGEQLLDKLALEVDGIEARMVEKYPRIRHIDLEAE
jgi:zinc transporter 9